MSTVLASVALVYSILSFAVIHATVVLNLIVSFTISNSVIVKLLMFPVSLVYTNVRLKLSLINFMYSTWSYTLTGISIFFPLQTTLVTVSIVLFP